jgi:transposase
MDILDMPGGRLLEAPLDGEGYRLVAEFLSEPDACQGCGAIGRMYRHGTHATTYRDSPIRGHQVRIVVNVRRYSVAIAA